MSSCHWFSSAHLKGVENGRSEGRGPGTAANDDMMKRKQTCPTGGQAADNDGQKNSK